MHPFWMSSSWVKARDAPHQWWVHRSCSRRLHAAPLLWCSFLHWQSTCKISCNGFSLLSPNPGGEAQRRCVPQDRHGCKEAETGLGRKWIHWSHSCPSNSPTINTLFLFQADGGKSDAWSKYMAEVKKYKDHQCCDDDKTRPLVK